LNSVKLSKSQFCQQGFEPYDILIDGKKVGGNAQRRSKDVIFQHGSINLDNSCFSLGYSLEDLDINIGFKQAKKLLTQSFETSFNIKFEHYNKELTDDS